MFGPRVQAEVGGACFVGDDVAITTPSEENDPDSDDDLAPNMLALWSADRGTFLWRTQLAEPAGDVVNFHGDLLTLRSHPRLYSGADGFLLYEWPDLATGDAECSIVWDKGFSGPARVAVDPHVPRFAVTDGEKVTIVTTAA